MQNDLSFLRAKLEEFDQFLYDDNPYASLIPRGRLETILQDLQQALDYYEKDIIITH